ncbi:unnamed protein product, partial [Iphiclides podalirius]
MRGGGRWVGDRARVGKTLNAPSNSAASILIYFCFSHPRLGFEFKTGRFMESLQKLQVRFASQERFPQGSEVHTNPLVVNAVNYDPFV